MREEGRMERFIRAFKILRDPVKVSLNVLDVDATDDRRLNKCEIASAVAISSERVCNIFYQYLILKKVGVAIAHS